MRRAVRVLRRDGPGGLALAALRHTVYRRVTLIERDLTDQIPIVRSEVPFQVMRLGREDIDAYRHYRSTISASEIVRRLDRGSLCYVAWHAGRIISAAWYQPGEAWIEDIDRRFALPPNTVYAYDAHTVSELRGLRVAPGRASAAQAQLRDSGFRRGIAYVLGGYRPGERSRLRSGWRRFGVAGYLNLGVARIDFVRARRNPLQWRLRRRRSRGHPRPEPPPLEPTTSLMG